MKNVKKILAIALTLGMVLSVAALICALSAGEGNGVG